MDTLTSVRVFCLVAELKSFTAAARRLGLSPAVGSKHVMHLENRLGTRLLNRTSRRVSATEAGQLYYVHAKQMLDGLDEVEAAIGNVGVVPRGTLKFSAPVWLASMLLARALADYRQLYPHVRFDIDFSGRMVNLVEEGFDLALRAVSSSRLEPGLVARPLRQIEFSLVGSPSYLAREGRPTKAADLNGHSLLASSVVNASGSLTVKGSDKGEVIKFNVVMQSENETMLRFAALNGMGLVFLPSWLVESDIAEGRLEEVLPDAIELNTMIYAVYPSRKYLSAKARTFIDFLADFARRAGGVSDIAEI